VEGWRLRESVEENFVGVAMIEGKLEVALASLGQGAGAAQGGEEFDPGLDADGAKDVVAVLVTLLDRRRSGASCFGDAAHGERLFASPRPEPAGGVQDALFEFGICMSGQRPASIPLKITRWPYCFNNV
jgi:hypothetical protein